MSIHFPQESDAYRAARQALLIEEIALRAQVERVAQMRRALPPGGETAQDYTFTDLDGSHRPMSEMFTTDRQTLAVYSLMYRPDAEAPCPMCVSMLDGLAAQASHIGAVVDLVVVAAAHPDQLSTLKAERGWTHLRLYSADGTTYQSDYHGQADDGAQVPMMNIFRKAGDRITHFWGSEGFFADVEGHPRHVDQIWPLWNVLDLTPDGRGDWFPSLSY